MFEPDFVSELIRTNGYWTLRSVSPDAVRVNTLVRSEYESRVRVFEGVVTALKAESKRWGQKAAPLLVPDTNVFLDAEYPVDGIKWPALIEAKIDVRVVVPLVVVHELDRLKRQGNSTTSKMARGAIRWLAARLPADATTFSEPFGMGHPDATVEAYVHDGPSRPDDADGVIIEFSRWLRVASDLPVHLVTRDLGMSLRARTAGVDHVARIGK